MRKSTPNWIQTFQGKRFMPLEPRIEDLSRMDIAHALSNICRYTGHCKDFYCPTPEQRILTADLRWIAAGDLTLGQEIFGFDEEPKELGSTGKLRRRFRPAVVTATVPLRRRVIRLELSDGTILRSSAEHPWLVATKRSNNQAWETAETIYGVLNFKSIRHGFRKRYINRYFDTWKNREGSWLAGIFDGEGTFSAANRGGTQLAIAQNPGLVQDAIEKQLRALNMQFTCLPSNQSRCIQTQIRGGFREMARLLGTIRPMRLLQNFGYEFQAGCMNKQLSGIREPLEIVAAVDEGTHDVAGLSTSTKTYFCEGFGSHNSVAEHSVLVSRRAENLAYTRYSPQVDATKYALTCARYGLFHDASEAYLTDIAKPLKQQQEFIYYREAERRLQDLIVEWLGLCAEEPSEVTQADAELLATEASQIMNPELEKDTWYFKYPPIKGLKIQCWEPKVAEQQFLRRAKELDML